MTATIEGLFNFRDTGGMPLEGGGATRAGALYRSAALNALTETGLDELSATPIGVIADFRTAVEQQMAPDRLPAKRPFRAVSLPLLDGALPSPAAGAGGAVAPEAFAAALADIPSLGELYVSMLTHGATTFAEMARLVIAGTDDAPSAVLVHCTAGKDRTGVAIALLLGAVGVERDAIVADYASSQQHLAGAWAERMLQTVASFGVPLTPELTTLVTGTPPDAIHQALDWVDAVHGGTADYLRSGGIDDDELTALRARLVG